MKNLNRRELCVALSALAAVGAPAQTAASQTAPQENVLSTSEVFEFKDLPVKPSANGGASRAVTHGVLATGEAVEVHETTLPPGKMPHPPHRHRHSEFIFLREGSIEFYNDGKPERVTPGGVIFIASNVLHGMKNVGDTDAQYCVVAIGRESGVRPV